MLKQNGRLTKSAANILLAISLVVGQLVFLSAPKAYAFSGGTGTSGDPYQISTPAELASLTSYLGSSYSNTYFELANDINLNVSPYNSGTGWTPIGSSSGSAFRGHFDGGGHTISNLFIDNASSGSQALFGYIYSGSVESVILRDINVTGGSSGIAGLVGTNYYGTVQRVGVEGGTLSGLMRVGAVVGNSDHGTNNQIYSTGVNITQRAAAAHCCIGGIVGSNERSSTLANSYARNNLVHTSSGQGAFGGAVGNTYDSSTISNIYATGSITTLASFPTQVGGVNGSNYVPTTASYWDTQTGYATSPSGTGLTTLQMKDSSNYSGWDFSTIWAISSSVNDGYPYLRWQSTNATPDDPDISGSNYKNGSWGTNTAPLFAFNLNDADTGDQLYYRVQVDDNSDFSSPVVDYTSGPKSQGSFNFFVGQADGEGTSGVGSYTVGAPGQTLSSGQYYWRVRSFDDLDAASGWTTANSGAVAFGVDVQTPLSPSAPATTTPSQDYTPTWTWTASEDNESGLADPIYTIEWSKDNTFATGVSSATTNSTSYAHTAPLADGVWYARVTATDNVGNAETSSLGHVVIDSSNVNTDSDAISDAVENSAPNDGDANNDGTLDSQQSNVASMLDPVSGEYAVLATDQGCSITALSIAAESSHSNDVDYDYPVGLMNFTLDCGEPGVTAAITQYYYGVTGDLVVRKYSPSFGYTTIESASTSSQVIAGEAVKVAMYQVVDGSSLDLDGAQNGVIEDPAGLAVRAGGDLADTGHSMYVYIYTVLSILLIGGVLTLFRARSTVEN